MNNDQLDNELPPEISIRNARVEDAENIFELLRREEPNWSHSFCLMNSLLELFPGCGQIAVTEEEDICGTGFGIPTSDDEGYVTNILVRRDQRRRGIGKALLRNCVNFLGKRNLFIFSTSAGFGMHIRRGFRLDSGKLEVRSGRISGEKISKTAPLDGLEIEDMKKTNINDLVEYDRKFQLVKRDWLYKQCLGSAEGVVGKVAFVDRQAVGFAYVLISPPNKPVLTIYADTPGIARAVLSSLCHSDNVPTNDDWVLVVPHDNREARSLVRQFGLGLDGVLSPMYTKHALAISWQNIYATHCINYNHC